MKIYADSVDFFIDVPNGWDHFCRYPKNKTWEIKSLQPYTKMNVYRDIEGANVNNITNQALYSIQRRESRINEHACLPILYALGNRFIKLQKMGVADFKCAMFPLSLVEKQQKDEEIQNIKSICAQWKRLKKSEKVKQAKKAKKGKKK